MPSVKGSITATLGLDTKKFQTSINRVNSKLSSFKGAITSKFAGVFAVGALGAYTNSVKDLATEIDNLSRIAGVNIESFQRITQASSRFGVSQEKVGDILKDVNDKVGDFLQTGGGPLKDFFENIAPQVGVTADQFKGLASDEALGLYVKSLQKANLSQADMTFFMEAIANDATALLPLFSDNAEALKTLGDEAEKAGRIMSEETVEALKQADTVIKEAIRQAQVFFAEALVGVIEIAKNIKGAIDGTNEATTGKRSARNRAKSQKEVEKAIITSEEKIQKLRKDIISQKEKIEQSSDNRTRSRIKRSLNRSNKELAAEEEKLRQNRLKQEKKSAKELEKVKKPERKKKSNTDSLAKEDLKTINEIRLAQDELYKGQEQREFDRLSNEQKLKKLKDDERRLFEQAQSGDLEAAKQLNRVIQQRIRIEKDINSEREEQSQEYHDAEIKRIEERKKAELDRIDAILEAEKKRIKSGDFTAEERKTIRTREFGDTFRAQGAEGETRKDFAKRKLLELRERQAEEARQRASKVAEITEVNQGSIGASMTTAKGIKTEVEKMTPIKDKIKEESGESLKEISTILSDLKSALGGE